VFHDPLILRLAACPPVLVDQGGQPHTADDLRRAIQALELSYLHAREARGPLAPYIRAMLGTILAEKYTLLAALDPTTPRLIAEVCHVRRN